LHCPFGEIDERSGGRKINVYCSLIGPRSNRQSLRTLRKSSSLWTRKTEKLWKNYVMTKSTPTLTQSGLLAVLLQRQRYKVIQLARRRAQRKHARAVLWSNLTWLLAVLAAPSLVDDCADRL